MWRLRLSREAPIYLLCALLAAGTAAGVRLAVAPPREGGPPLRDQSLARDRPAESLAVLFARRYLTWNAAEPLASQRAVAALTGSPMGAGAGFLPPAAGEQRVQWAEVVQERSPVMGVRVYTVAAQTDTGGLVYLTVTVQRASDGALQLGGYPALVGAPASAPAQLPRRGEVGDASLTTVVARALRNYLAGSTGELAADLVAGARVSPPPVALSLLTVQHIDWASTGGAVVVLATAQDPRGAQYTLEYEIDVVVRQGRWEVAALQTDPYAQ